MIGFARTQKSIYGLMSLSNGFFRINIVILTLFSACNEPKFVNTPTNVSGVDAADIVTDATDEDSLPSESEGQGPNSDDSTPDNSTACVNRTVYQINEYTNADDSGTTTGYEGIVVLRDAENRVTSVETTLITIDLRVSQINGFGVTYGDDGTVSTLMQTYDVPNAITFSTQSTFLYVTDSTIEYYSEDNYNFAYRYLYNGFNNLVTIDVGEYVGDVFTVQDSYSVDTTLESGLVVYMYISGAGGVYYEHIPMYGVGDLMDNLSLSADFGYGPGEGQVYFETNAPTFDQYLLYHFPRMGLTHTVESGYTSMDLTEVVRCIR